MCGSGKTCKYYLCLIPSNQITLSKSGTARTPVGKSYSRLSSELLDNLEV